MPFQHHVLPNGLNIVGEVSPTARSAAVGFFVRTGARDEDDPAIAGVTHFLEHMIFKGTPRRTALEVNRDFDAIGANYNAFTSEENTVFHASVLPEYLPQAVDILADILRPSLRVEDFDMEKKVIIDEIGMYDDQPTSCLYERAKKAYFGEHPLGNSVLGTVESITNLTRDQMNAYYRNRYTAPNITVAVAGQFDWNAFIEWISRSCGHWPTGSAARSHLREAPANPSFQSITKETVAQEHGLLISPAPSSRDPLRHAADILMMVLGDSTGSRLYWELVDPGLAESADASYYDFDAAGSYFTSFSCDPEDTAEILARISDIIGELQKNSITAEELATAKSKVLTRVVRGGERPGGRMQSLGMSWTYLGTCRSVDDELRAFEAVQLADVRTLLEKYPITRPAIFALGPLQEVENTFTLR